MGKEITLVKPSAHILASLQHCIHHHCNAGSLFSSATLVLPIHLFPGVTGRALKLGKGSGGLSLEAVGGWGREHISSTLSRARRGPGSAANFLQVKVRAGLWKRRRVPRDPAKDRSDISRWASCPASMSWQGASDTPSAAAPLPGPSSTPFPSPAAPTGPFVLSPADNSGARCSESWARCLFPQKSHPGSAQHHLVPRGGQSWVLGAQGTKRGVLLTWWVQTSSSHLRNVRHSV